jgi:type 1 fimbria pilin
MASGNVFPTNVPGVGFRIARPNNLSLGDYPFGTPGRTTTDLGIGSSTMGYQYSVVFVKTGDITGGTVNSGAVAYWDVGNVHGITFMLSSPVTFVGASTCAVNPNSINVPVMLPSITTFMLPSVGSVNGRTPFNLSLDCTGAGRAVSVRLDYNGTNTNLPGVLNSTGTAVDVGVQLLDQNAQPVSYGVVVAKGSSSQQGIMNIPFYAQYYRTGPNLMAGTVRSSATYTFSYP